MSDPTSLPAHSDSHERSEPASDHDLQDLVVGVRINGALAVESITAVFESLAVIALLEGRDPHVVVHEARRRLEQHLEHLVQRAAQLAARVTAPRRPGEEGPGQPIVRTTASRRLHHWTCISGWSGKVAAHRVSTEDREQLAIVSRSHDATGSSWCSRCYLDCARDLGVVA